MSRQTVNRVLRTLFQQTTTVAVMALLIAFGVLTEPPQIAAVQGVLSLLVVLGQNALEDVGAVTDRRVPPE